MIKPLITIFKQNHILHVDVIRVFILIKRVFILIKRVFILIKRVFILIKRVFILIKRVLSDHLSYVTLCRCNYDNRK
jgi:hypothetical protein